MPSGAPMQSGEPTQFGEPTLSGGPTQSGEPTRYGEPTRCGEPTPFGGPTSPTRRSTGITKQTRQTPSAPLNRDGGANVWPLAAETRASSRQDKDLIRGSKNREVLFGGRTSLSRIKAKSFCPRTRSRTSLLQGRQD